MNSSQTAHSDLVKKVVIRVTLAMPAMMALFFIPAGTSAYWEASLYLSVILMPMFLALRYLLKNDPLLNAIFTSLFALPASCYTLLLGVILPTVID